MRSSGTGRCYGCAGLLGLACRGATLDCTTLFLALAFPYTLYYDLAAIFMCVAALATGYWVTGLIRGLTPTMFASLICGVTNARRTGSKAPAEVAWCTGTLFALLSSVSGTALFALLPGRTHAPADPGEPGGAHGRVGDCPDRALDDHHRIAGFLRVEVKDVARPGQRMNASALSPRRAYCKARATSDRGTT